MGSGYGAAYDALDLGADEALDQWRQVGVEPLLQQRTQLLADDVLDRGATGVNLHRTFHRQGAHQGADGGDRGGGGLGCDKALCAGWA